MRLDARKGDHNYFVWDVPAAKHLKRIQWVDDETNQYGTYPDTLSLGMSVTTVQRKKIEIHLDKRLVLIDPVDDGGDAQDDGMREPEFIYAMKITDPVT